jgi:hypothetical protein
VPRNPDKSYVERDSPFFRLRSQKKLARLLRVSKAKMREMGRAKDLYRQFRQPKPSGGYREISAPRDDLKAVQRRIAHLLQRITPPDYLFAPVAGRSYVDNAAKHLGASSIRLLDVEDYFPSCTENKVIWFFRGRMECSPDVSAIIKGLVCREGSLPQGSPCSPILAYLCYVDMWEEISRIVHNSGCTLSVYADDLTISGEVVPEAAIWEVKRALRKHGHRHKSSKERSRRLRPAEVTGVIVRPDGLHAPNRQHKRLHELRGQIKQTASAEAKTHLSVQLRGREAQISQILSGNSASRAVANKPCACSPPPTSSPQESPHL